MTIKPFLPWIALSIALLVSACATGTAGPEPQPTMGDTTTGDSIVTTAAPESRTVLPPDTVEPPDGEWLVDEEGREYYLMEYSKEFQHRRLPDGMVHLGWGVRLFLSHEDDDFLYLKVFRPEDPGPPIQVGPTPEQREAIAASYQVELERTDRLRFERFADGLPDHGQWRNGFEIADIDGDGHLDIVHGPIRKGGDIPAIFLGDGRGNWRYWEEARFPGGLLDYGDVAVADFTGDGRPDLAVASHLRGIAVLVQREPGHFVRWGEGIEFSIPGEGGTGGGFSSRRIVAADWTGNGLPDIIAHDEGPRLGRGAVGPTGAPLMDIQLYGPRVYANQGDGTWQTFGLTEPTSQELFGDHLAVADLDGSGRVDFVTSANAIGRTDLVHRNVDGESWSREALDQVRPRAYIRAVATGDFDGDGRPDLALAYISFEGEVWRNGIDLFLARDSGEWERQSLYAREGRNAIVAIATGDLSGDGTLDLVGLDTDGSALVFLGDGRGSFVLEEAPELQQPYGACRGYDVRLADINGNGRDEIVAAYAEDGGTDPFGRAAPVRCPSEGGLMAWTVESRSQQRR